MLVGLCRAGECFLRKFSVEDDRFLEDLKRRCYRYFEESAHPETGLIADRWPSDGGDVWDTAGIAAVGFGLTGHAIAAERGWISREEAEARCRKVLCFLRDHVEHKNGFFYQWVDRATGKRAAGSPASSIDNALLLAGAITAAQAFPESDLGPIVDSLYRSMDWQWMLNGNDLLNHGWNPEEGFLATEWSSYCELMILLKNRSDFLEMYSLRRFAEGVWFT